MNESIPKTTFCQKIAGVLGFVALCFLYGTSYGIAQFGLGYYKDGGATLIALRMIFGFVATLLIFIGRFTFEPKIRFNIIDSVKNHKWDMVKSAFGGIMYYGFPHSLIGITQDVIPSNTIHIAQSCVPLFATIFANFMLPDEKFSFKRFYPQVLALIGTVLTAIPTMDSDYSGGATTKQYIVDFILLAISIASFGFGSVFMKSHLASVEPTLCGVFQLLGSAVFSVIFAVIYEKPSTFAEHVRNGGIGIIWPLILGMVHTCGCAYIFLFTCKILGAIIASFSNFGQIVIGILIGVFFFSEWESYKTKDYVMSGIGLVVLTLAIICGFFSDKPDSIKREDSVVSLISDQQGDNDLNIPEYDVPNFKKPLLS